jgi:hypothetical protein
MQEVSLFLDSATFFCLPLTTFQQMGQICEKYTMPSSISKLPSFALQKQVRTACGSGRLNSGFHQLCQEFQLVVIAGGSDF